MNYKNLRLVIAALIAVSSSLSPLQAADEESIFGPDKTSILKETGRPASRVFGVQGPAPEVDYYIIEMTQHSPKSSAIRSAFVPGWGQAYNRQRVKGALLFTTFAALTFGAIEQYNASKDSYDTYRERGLSGDPSYDDYESEQTRAWILGTAALALWGFAIVDAYRNAYNPLWSKKDGVEIVAMSDGGGLVWKKSFGQP